MVMRWARLICLAAVVVAMSGCTSGPGTTRPTLDDLQDMTAAMARSLLQSHAFAQRTAESEPWVISIDRVENLSSEVMTQSEQWYLIHRIRSSVPLVELAEQRNIRFVMPPERLTALREQYDLPESQTLGTDRQVTHVMTATFRSVTRAVALERSDLFYCEFEILDMRTYEPVWNDHFEWKRAARGHIWD